MSRKSKTLQPKRDDEPNSICHICKDWCNPVASGDAACEYCPHSYHDKCLSSQFRDRNFNMCSELDQQCDNESPPIRFALGKQQDQTVHTTKKKHKKKSQRTAPTPKKKPKSCVHGIHKTIYDSFEYCGVTYQNGDDVVLDNCGNGMVKDLDIARITDIYSYDDDRMPKIAIIYYHQASQIRECKTTDDEFDQETADREIYIDETYPSHANIDELFSRTSSSKALVVGSREHYLQEKQRKNSEDLYHDIYWCTHSYHHGTQKKHRLPPDMYPLHISSADDIVFPHFNQGVQYKQLTLTFDIRIPSHVHEWLHALLTMINAADIDKEVDAYSWMVLLYPSLLLMQQSKNTPHKLTTLVTKTLRTLSQFMCREAMDQGHDLSLNDALICVELFANNMDQIPKSVWTHINTLMEPTNTLNKFLKLSCARGKDIKEVQELLRCSSTQVLDNTSPGLGGEDILTDDCALDSGWSMVWSCDVLHRMFSIDRFYIPNVYVSMI